MKETFDKNVQFIIDIWQGSNPFKLADVLLQGSLIKFDQDIWVLQLLDKTYGYCYSIFLEKGRKTVQHHLTNWFHTFHKTFEGSKENDSVEDRTSHPGVFCVCVCVCVFTSIHLESFICLGLEVQGTDQRCCVEDVIFLCQVPSTILQYESPSLSN